MTIAAYQAISDEAQRALDKAFKILQLASRKEGNEAEAAVAAQKFQEVLTKYNLDAAAVAQSGKEQSGAREDMKLAGGAYKYQRELWAWAAELHFCLYWSVQTWDAVTKRRRDAWTGELRERTEHKRVWKHQLVGRTVNVRATIALAQYLEQAIERVVMEAVGQDNKMRFSRYAVSMREGIADRLCEKMAQKRRDLLREEQRRHHEMMEQARNAAREGVSTETAITLTTYAQAERDANLDHIYGEGWSAKQAKRRAEAAERQARKEAEYAAWAEANPEEARKEAEAAERRARRYRSRGGTKAREKDWGAYYRGRDAAEKIGLDTQVDESRRKQIGGAR